MLMLVFTLRTFWKERFYSFNTIGSLAVGLAVSFLVLGYLRYELAYDRWIPEAEQIYLYRIVAEVTSDRDSTYYFVTAPTGALDLPERVSGVVVATAFEDADTYVLKDGVPQELTVRRAPPNSLEMFPTPVLHGDPAAALATPDSVVLTRAAASQLFGDRDAMGERLETAAGESYRVGAVVESLPEQTHIDFDILLPMPASYAGAREWSWSGNMLLYLKLEAGASIEALRPAIGEVTRERVPPPAGFGGSGESSLEVRLCPLARLHFQTQGLCGAWEKPPVAPERLTAFAAIGAGVLLLGVMNFSSIALARSLRRSGEVALRKTLGASRGRIMRQLLGESVLVALVALALGLALAALFAGPFSALAGSAEPPPIFDGTVLASATGLALLAGLAGGAYPAFVSSRQAPGRILGGTAERLRGSRVLTGLTILQFSLGIGLAVAAIVIYQQSARIETADFGYDADGVVVVEVQSDHADVLRRMAAELRMQAGIAAVARANGGPGAGGFAFTEIASPQRANPLRLQLRRAEAPFFDVYGVLPRRRPEAPPLAEVWSGTAALINETAVEDLGFASPEAAIGASLSHSVGEGERETLRILGIVPDSYSHTKAPPEPRLYTPLKQNKEASNRFLMARLVPGLEQQALAAIDEAWQRHGPNRPIERYFAAQRLAWLYQEHRDTAVSFGIGAGVALALAALGLFGLAAVLVERRRPEIAVRKVLGARLADVLRLVTWQLLKPMAPSMLLAWAVAFYFLTDWLESFVIRIDLTPAPFALAGLGGVLVGGAAVIVHAVRAATLHPAEVLRVE